MDGGFGGCFQISSLLSSNDIYPTTSKISLFSIDKGRCLSAGFGSTQQVFSGLSLASESIFFIDDLHGYNCKQLPAWIGDSNLQAPEDLRPFHKRKIHVSVQCDQRARPNFRVSSVRAKNRGKTASLNINFFFTSQGYLLMIVSVILIQLLILLLKVRKINYVQKNLNIVQRLIVQV
ncbi:MAG: hypothetical protein EZS28_015353 [Streblomastix strix]|uniref:Uncharacterized protein n=1 Tax=Streblomastix strix TaxID=222440 RepID=A0A5J4W2H9_9EUKA|nr:MAG: hypothetical protein EZS28_015353 [Streblomastix strix]